MGTARSRLAAENGLLINSKRETHHFRAAFIPYGSVSLDAFLQNCPSDSNKEGVLYMPSAEILSVGTELLLGDIINTDAAYISRRLAEFGIPLYRQSVVGDNASRLRDALCEALRRADIVFLTGGLGPTCDDITKNIVSDVFRRPLATDPDTVRSLERYFSDIGRPMTDNNLSQALIPEGAVALKNRHGTAPGIILTGIPTGASVERTAILLPGPPHELCPMFEESVVPFLEGISKRVLFSLNLHLFGIGESAAEAELRPIMESSTNPTVAPYACEAEVRIRITAGAESRDECLSLCRDMAERIRHTSVGRYIFAESTSADVSSEVLVRHTIDALRERGMTVGTAESCTAGMIASRIADIPGSSDVLVGGIVSYANSIKENVLGVRSDILRTYGAVSEECAAAMAMGARRRLGCDIAVSVTGIAGPGGGTPEKPVGTVCFGISDADGTETETVHFGAMSDRGRVRRMTTSYALMKILKRIQNRQ